MMTQSNSVILYDRCIEYHKFSKLNFTSFMGVVRVSLTTRHACLCDRGMWWARSLAVTNFLSIKKT